MEKFITTTGKTIDLAVAAALEQLQLDRDSVSVEVLEYPKSGFLGIGAAPAKVKVTYEAPDEVPAPALSSASRSPRKPWKPVSEQKKAEEPKAAPAPQTAPAQKSAPAVHQPEQKAASKQRPAEPKQPAAQPKPAPIQYTPPEPGSVEARAEVFLKGLLEYMGSDAVPHAVRQEEGCHVELVGSSLGMLIGRRGETLDAIQHLANYAVNHGSGKRVRITVDAENYRAKREESLERLAFKVAGKVVRYRKNMTLEPMNAYERHVIHAALQSYQDVTTYSTGTEPNRRIVIAYSKGAGDSAAE